MSEESVIRVPEDFVEAQNDLKSDVRRAHLTRSSYLVQISETKSIDGRLLLLGQWRIEHDHLLLQDTQRHSDQYGFSPVGFDHFVFGIFTILHAHFDACSIVRDLLHDSLQSDVLIFAQSQRQNGITITN